MTAKTLYELEMAEPTGKAGLAAAAAASRVMRILERAQAATGATNKEIAERVGVTEGRVSQVLNGDGNIRISTLARFIAAMGLNLKLDAITADGHSVAPPRVARTREPRSAAQVPPSVRCKVDLTWITNMGVTTSVAEVEHDGASGAPVLYGAHVRSYVALAGQGPWHGHEDYVLTSKAAVESEDLVARADGALV